LGIIDPRRRYARGHDIEGVYGDPADGHVTLDHASGRLETVAEELFDGLLPEGPAFDTDGKFVGVTVFDHLDLTRRRSAMRFWELIQDDRQPHLRPKPYSLEVIRGAHTLVVV